MEDRSLKKDTNLFEIERLISSLKPNKEQSLWLPRNSKAILFKETWLFMMLETLVRNSKVTVCDYGVADSELSRGELINKIADSVVGISSFYGAYKVLDKGGRELKYSNLEVVQHLSSPFINEKLEKRTGVVECFAVDPDFPDPPQFASVERIRGRFLPSKWKEVLKELVESRLALYLGDGIKVEKFFTCVYEAFENTKKHGSLRLQEGGVTKIIPGPRYFSIKSHSRAAYSKTSYLASGFSELENYLSSYSTGSFTKYLEVCISDRGEGIAKRYRGSGIDGGGLEMSDSELINYILENNKTSDFDDSTSGHGLETMLRAVDQMNGFISIRCNAAWLYYFRNRSEVGNNAQPKIFRNVTFDGELPEVVGTHINILFPVSIASKKSTTLN